MPQTFDLEQRTLQFAKRIQQFAAKIPRSLLVTENIKQLTRSAGSIGANYIEANDALGLRDFLMRLRISRKEAKEAQYWLSLIEVNNDIELITSHKGLLQEAHELRLILSAIIKKVELQSSSTEIQRDNKFDY